MSVESLMARGELWFLAASEDSECQSCEAGSVPLIKISHGDPYESVELCLVCWGAVLEQAAKE